MKLSKETLNTLKNFTNINTSILVRPGNVLSTISSNQTMLAKAEVAETFEKEFAIYNLPEFLSLLTLTDDVEFELHDTHAVLKNKDGFKTRYLFAAPNVVTAAPKKEIQLPSVDVSIHLKEEYLTKAIKLASILNLPHVAFVGKDGKLSMKVTKSSEEDGNSSSFELGDTDKEFKVFFKIDYLKVLEGDYNIEVSAQGISKFTNATKPFVYWISVETDSVFN